MKKIPLYQMIIGALVVLLIYFIVRTSNFYNQHEAYIDIAMFALIFAGNIYTYYKGDNNGQNNNDLPD